MGGGNSLAWLAVLVSGDEFEGVKLLAVLGIGRDAAEVFFFLKLFHPLWTERTFWPAWAPRMTFSEWHIILRFLICKILTPFVKIFVALKWVAV